MYKSGMFNMLSSTIRNSFELSFQIVSSRVHLFDLVVPLNMFSEPPDLFSTVSGSSSLITNSFHSSSSSSVLILPIALCNSLSPTFWEGFSVIPIHASLWLIFKSLDVDGSVLNGSVAPINKFWGQIVIDCFSPRPR